MDMDNRQGIILVINLRQASRNRPPLPRPKRIIKRNIELSFFSYAVIKKAHTRRLPNSPSLYELTKNLL